jgi:hypothetical protein
MSTFPGKPDAISKPTFQRIFGPGDFWKGLDLRWDTASRDFPKPKMKPAFRSPERSRNSIFDFPASALDGLRRGERVFSRRNVLPLALLIASWQFSASARAQTGIIISPDIFASSLTPTNSREHAKAFGVDGIDCIRSEDQEKQPLQDSTNFPDSMTDIDDSDGGLDDFNSDTSTRNYKDTPLLSVTGLDAAILRAPGIIPVRLLRIHSFSCLRDHIRERAPPVLV